MNGFPVSLHSWINMTFITGSIIFRAIGLTQHTIDSSVRGLAGVPGELDQGIE